MTKIKRIAASKPKTRPVKAIKTFKGSHKSPHESESHNVLPNFSNCIDPRASAQTSRQHQTRGSFSISNIIADRTFARLKK